MKLSTDRILTTHAGSLPRPHDLRRMMLDADDGVVVDRPALDARIKTAVAEIVAKQREAGIDVISDGEMGKIGFSNYVYQHLAGELTRLDFLAQDIAPFPELAQQLFGQEGAGHIRRPITARPLEPRDPAAIQTEIDDFAAALGDLSPDDAFITAVTPGMLVFQFPNDSYPSREEHLRAAAQVLAPEYRAIVAAGFNLQLDSPDVAMACHCVIDGQAISDPLAHVDASTAVLNDALAGLPPEKIRLHVCWGNYGGPHHKDVELRELLPALLKTRAGFISVEAANPRHEHEWEVWQDIRLPDDKALIPGVIDTNNNRVEHPRLVAQRIERFARIVGRERVIAGTDCGFETFLGLNPCDPQVAWLKLEALVEGARIASQRLWADDRTQVEATVAGSPA